MCHNDNWSSVWFAPESSYLLPEITQISLLRMVVSQDIRFDFKLLTVSLNNELSWHRAHTSIGELLFYDILSVILDVQKVTGNEADSGSNLGSN